MWLTSSDEIMKRVKHCSMPFWGVSCLLACARLLKASNVSREHRRRQGDVTRWGRNALTSQPSNVDDWKRRHFQRRSQTTFWNEMPPEFVNFNNGLYLPASANGYNDRRVTEAACVWIPLSAEIVNVFGFLGRLCPAVIPLTLILSSSKRLIYFWDFSFPSFIVFSISAPSRPLFIFGLFKETIQFSPQKMSTFSTGIWTQSLYLNHWSPPLPIDKGKGYNSINCF